MFIQMLILNYQGILIYVSLLSIFLFIISIIVTPIIICKIPHNYFIKEKKRISIFKKIIKNIFGIFFLIIGFVFLFTPGQGILTILIGIIFLDFPNKKNLQMKFIKKYKIIKPLNYIRRKFNKKEFILN